MEALIEFIKILVPAALVLYAMFLVVKAFLNKEVEKATREYKANNSKEVIPIRLQAYERMVLFLERISPNNLVMRLNQPQMSAKELQQIMLQDVRDEYNHNVSQQVYMSDECWDLVKNAKEDLIVTINTASENIPKESSSKELAKAIFQEVMQKEIDPIALALHEIKDEIRQSF
jgi:predicted AlkP superfamily phosphohydrolase/phosphomutase